MKKMGKICFVFVLSLVLYLPSTITLAAPVDSAKSMDNNNRYLIFTETSDNGDGTYSIEKLYTKHHPGYYRSEMSGTDEFIKVKEEKLSSGTLIVSYQITATFDWDTRTKKVQVYDAVGELTYNQGGDITKEKTTTSGNNTKKASAKYSFTRKTSLGFSKKYSVSASCNYKGKDS